MTTFYKFSCLKSILKAKSFAQIHHGSYDERESKLVKAPRKEREKNNSGVVGHCKCFPYHWATLWRARVRHPPAEKLVESAPTALLSILAAFLSDTTKLPTQFAVVVHSSRMWWADSLGREEKKNKQKKIRPSRPRREERKKIFNWINFVRDQKPRVKLSDLNFEWVMMTMETVDLSDASTLAQQALSDTSDKGPVSLEQISLEQIRIEESEERFDEIKYSR